MSLHAQQYEFVRDGGTFRLVEKAISMPLKPIDKRPLWKRTLSSVRPWFSASPGTKFEPTFLDNEFNWGLNGTVGVGLQAKVEF